MENKWIRLTFIIIIGIVASAFVLSMLSYFSNVAAMNQANNMNMPMDMQQQLYNIQQQVVSIKSMVGVGMPTAIALGLINLWRSFTKK